MANLGKSYANTDLMEEVGGGRKRSRELEVSKE